MVMYACCGMRLAFRTASNSRAGRASNEPKNVLLRKELGCAVPPQWRSGRPDHEGSSRMPERSTSLYGFLLVQMINNKQIGLMAP